MKVGDLVKSKKTGDIAIVVYLTKTGTALTFINEDVHFNNPTWITARTLNRCAEVISNAEGNSQS